LNMDSSISKPMSVQKMKVAASKSEEERTEKVKSYKCLICLKSFIKRSKLTNHTIMAHTNERPYKCKVCGWTSKTLAYLKQHERLHVGEKNYQCSKCPSEFSSCSDRTNILINVHTREKPFPCAECPAEFSQSSSLKSHIIGTHRKEEWLQNKCSLCNKKFATQSGLTKHLKTHTGERPYICSHSGCNKMFPSRGELNRHINFHGGEKKYICAVCGKGFVTIDIRNQHAKIHNKTFSCNICRKMFPSSYYLKVHQKSHSEHRQFKCEECPSSFFIKGQLNNHVRQIHRKLRPFPCSMCDRSFYRACQRDKHLSATHLNEQAYKCEICDRRFKRTSVHIKQHNQLTDLNCAVCPKRFLTRTDLLEPLKTTC
ncbi:putative zinc finger protein, partial [Orchesella cincta]